jgi:hypothetical protein
MDQELLRYTMKAALYSEQCRADSEFGRIKKANPFTDQISKAWQAAGPVGQGGLIGAGAGGALGLGSSLLGNREDKHPVQSALTGALGGAALGAGGALAYPKIMGMFGQKGQAGPSGFDQAKKTYEENLLKGVNPQFSESLGSVAAGMSPGPMAPGAALAGTAHGGAIQHAQLSGANLGQPGQGVDPAKFNDAKRTITGMVDKPWTALNVKDVDTLAAADELRKSREFNPAAAGKGALIGGVGGAVLGPVPRMLKDVGNWAEAKLQHARRPMYSGVENITGGKINAEGKVVPKVPVPGSFKQHNLPDGTNELEKLVRNLTPGQDRRIYRASQPNVIKRLLGMAPTGKTYLPQEGGMHVHHDTIRDLGRAAAPFAEGEGIGSRYGADSLRGGVIGASLGTVPEILRHRGWFSDYLDPDAAGKAVANHPGMVQ